MKSYYPKAKGIIFVVEADTARHAEAKAALDGLLGEGELTNTPLLVIGWRQAKQADSDVRAVLTKALELEHLSRAWNVATCDEKGPGLCGGDGLDWLACQAAGLDVGRCPPSLSSLAQPPCWGSE